MNELREYKEEMPIRSPLVNVMLITGDEILYATTVTHKQGLYQKWLAEDKVGYFIAVWTGEYRSDAFHLPATVMEKEFG
jgi:hypothetical protein